MATVKLDQVTGYALVSQPPTIKLDQISGYALVTDKVVNQYLLPAKEHVVQSVNLMHRLSLLPADVVLGSPVTQPAGQYNAAVDLSVLPSSGFSGGVTLRYFRSDIEDLVFNKDLDTLRYNGQLVTTHDIVPLFNQTYGTAISTDDIVDETIPLDRSTTLRAAASSLFFDPGTEVDVGVLCPSARDWELPNKALAWPDLTGQTIYAIDFSSRRGAWPLSQPPGATASVSNNNGEISIIATLINSYFSNKNFTHASHPSIPGVRGIGSCPWKIIALPSAQYPQCNSEQYNRAVVIDPATNGWFKTPLILHYNV